MSTSHRISLEEWEQLLQQNDAIILYLYNNICGVCKTLQPKIEELVRQEFPNIKVIPVNAEENRELAAQLRMLSVPGIILYMVGKEVFRSNGLIALGDFAQRVRRPYEMMFS